MAEIKIVRVDHGAVNARILAREVKTDFRKVETASIKMTTNFLSAEAKRQFVRYFNTVQLNAHFVSVIARTRLKPEDITQVESLLHEQLASATEKLNRGIDSAEALFKEHGIRHVATYDTIPLEIEVGIISSIGRRYFELMNKLDQLMPLLQTLEIHEVITENDADIQRARFKRLVRKVAISARHMATGLRRRMQGFDAAKMPPDLQKTEQESAAPASPVVTEIGHHDAVGGRE